MKNLKKLTLLHSNDMHGDFAAEQVDKNLVGGVSMLSGYINKVRIAASSCVQVIEEMLSNGSHQNAKGTGRLIIHKEDGTVTGVAF